MAFYSDEIIVGLNFQHMTKYDIESHMMKSSEEIESIIAGVNSIDPNYCNVLEDED